MFHRRGFRSDFFFFGRDWRWLVGFFFHGLCGLHTYEFHTIFVVGEVVLAGEFLGYGLSFKVFIICWVSWINFSPQAFFSR